MKLVILSLAVCLLSPTLFAQELESIPSDEIQLWGGRLVEAAGKLENLQVKVEGLLDKANGVHVPEKLGLLVVPQKGVEENDEFVEKLQAEKGTALGYLFAYRLVPVVEGKRVDSGKLRTVKLTDNGGNEHTVNVLLLAARQLSDEDYRLYVYGTDEKPLIDARFGEGSGPGAEPVAVEIKNPNVDTREGDVVISVFGKYQAKFRAGHQE